MRVGGELPEQGLEGGKINWKSSLERIYWAMRYPRVRTCHDLFLCIIQRLTNEMKQKGHRVLNHPFTVTEM